MKKLLPSSIAQQAHKSDPNSSKMAVGEDEKGNTNGVEMNGPQDVVMNDGELEVDENNEEDGFGDNSNAEEDSDNYNYEENDMEGDEDRDTDGYNEDDEGGVRATMRNLHVAVTMTRTVMAMFHPR